MTENKGKIPFYLGSFAFILELILRRRLCQKNQSNSKYLNSIKEKETENKEKIKVDRTYVEPQEFQSKNPKKINKFFRF